MHLYPKIHRGGATAPYADYITIGCGTFSEQVILNEHGYNKEPESDGVNYVLFSYGYYPGEHINKEAAKKIFSDVFAHGSSNVICQNSVMELCVKGDMKIFKKCMEKRIDTLRERAMNAASGSRWKRAYENNLRHFIRLYENINYSCKKDAISAAAKIKSSKELTNLVVFLMLQAKQSNPAYKKYEPVDPKQFVDMLTDDNAPVVTDAVLNSYMREYPEKIPLEIQVFFDNKSALQVYSMETILRVLYSIQHDSVISAFLTRQNRTDLLEVTPDPIATIHDIIKAVVDTHNKTEKALGDKLRKDDMQIVALNQQIKVEQAKLRDTSAIDELKAELAEAHEATAALKGAIEKLELSDTQTEELKQEFAALRASFEETSAAIQRQQVELENERTRAAAATGSFAPASKVNELEAKLNADIERNKALSDKISKYAHVVRGDGATAVPAAAVTTQPQGMTRT